MDRKPFPSAHLLYLSVSIECSNTTHNSAYGGCRLRFVLSFEFGACIANLAGRREPCSDAGFPDVLKDLCAKLPRARAPLLASGPTGLMTT